MNQDVTTLAEVFLGFGGKTMYTLGTACTAMGVIYGIHRLTGLGINIFNSLPLWLNMRKTQDKSGENDVLVTRKQVTDELTIYVKISLLILFGVAIKYFGNWLGLETTIAAINKLLYKS